MAAEMVVMRVAWQLVAEVLDHAPPDMTAAERLVLVAVAEYARVGPRTWTGPQADIARRAGLGSDGTRRVLGKLAARGLDLRVSLAADRNGRPIYAVPGRSPSFALPALAPPGCSCPSCTLSRGVPDGTPSRDKVGRSSRVDVPDVPGRRAAEPAQPGPAAHPHRPGDRDPSRAPAGSADVFEQARRARQRDIDACPDCDPRGWVEDRAGYPTNETCQHPKVRDGRRIDLRGSA